MKILIIIKISPFGNYFKKIGALSNSIRRKDHNL